MDDTPPCKLHGRYATLQVKWTIRHLTSYMDDTPPYNADLTQLVIIKLMKVNNHETLKYF